MIVFDGCQVGFHETVFKKQLKQFFHGSSNGGVEGNVVVVLRVILSLINGSGYQFVVSLLLIRCVVVRLEGVLGGAWLQGQSRLAVPTVLHCRGIPSMVFLPDPSHEIVGLIAAHKGGKYILKLPV